VQRDHAALLDESPDFPVMPEYEALVQGLYASAAAALALVARQLADRDDAGAECVAMRDVLQVCVCVCVCSWRGGGLCLCGFVRACVDQA
jgi:hypothetical protein